ncbi:uncharacterized protein LOC144452176 [Glandiceps talaboti]
MKMSNPRCYFDITISGIDVGRMVFELRADVVPKTVENFRVLCTGEKGYGYKGSIFYRILPGHFCQGGDFTNNDGTGGTSIYEEGYFEDENFELKHIGPGFISMANHGPNKNGSQFFITNDIINSFDGKHVVFGHIEEGFDILQGIDGVGTDTGRPRVDVVIKNCGQLS